MLRSTLITASNRANVLPRLHLVATVRHNGNPQAGIQSNSLLFKIKSNHVTRNNPTCRLQSNKSQTPDKTSAELSSGSSKVTSAEPSNQLPKAFSIGAFAGVLGSLAGMGGGFVMIPLMTSSLLRLPQHAAHGTSLFAVAATGVAGALGYGLTDVVELDSAAAIAVCGMFSARLGAKATTKLSEQTLKKALGVFMLCVAPLVPGKAYIAKMYGDKQEKEHLDNAQVDSMKKLLPAGAIGLGSGFLAGLFGVGGGAVVVPALTMTTDMTHYTALGTSLCAMSLPAIVGTITHYQKGNVAVRIAPALALGSFLGAYFGGKVGTKIPEDKLRYGFSGLMVVLGTKTLLKV